MAIQYFNRGIELPKTSKNISERFKHDQWLMTDAERATLAALLENLRPECAIEIGTYEGGSLGVLAKYCKKVYSLDINPKFRDEHGHKYPNVEFIIGNTRDTLKKLIKSIESNGEKLGFVIVDADHTESGVRSDVNDILAYQPVCPLYIIMHDSFNPGCRKGILTANWSENPNVHLVETDYVVGRFVTREEGGFRSMWCGFGLAILLPEPRTKEVIVRQNESLAYKVAYLASVHFFQNWWNPIYSLPRYFKALKFKSRIFLVNLIKKYSPTVYQRIKERQQLKNV